MKHLKCISNVLILICLGMGNVLFAQGIYPGLYEPDGTPHALHTPNPVTGKTINILDYDVDLADNDKDDRPAIQAALDAAVFGDEIYFPNGTYNFNSGSPADSKAHLVLKNGVNLRGQSRQGVIFRSKFGDTSMDRFLKMRGSENIVIQNMTLTANFTGQYSTNVSENNPQAGGPKYVISIEDDGGLPSFNILVDSVKIANFVRMGIRLSNSHDVIVRNSYFSHATDVGGGGAGYGISIQGNGDQDNNSKWNLVENCDFIGPYVRHGIIIQYASHNNLVQTNYYNDTRLDAIDLHGEDEYQNEIYNNTTENITKGAGVGVGNTGATHDASGPYNYIHHNVMKNCREGVKVYLGSPNTRIEYNEITQSSVYDSKGVYILNGPNTIIRGNRIYSNSGTYFTGIYLKHDYGTEGKGVGDPKNVQILENEVYDNPYGLRIFHGDGIVLENNNLYNNTISDVYIASGVTFNKLLTATVVGSGSVSMDPPGGAYPEGSQVTVTALRGANWEFSHWEGALGGSTNPATILMDSSKTITAVFTEKAGSDEVALIPQIIGKGQVLLEPAGGIYDRGTQVTVKAVPVSAWKFIAWSGDLSGSVDSLLITADKDYHFTATFEALPEYSIFLLTQGSGTVEMYPPGGTYAQGTTVTLTAVPAEGWEFSSWGGNLSGSDNPIQVTIESDLAVMASFIESVGIVSDDLLPKQTFLYQNYPNPFNPSTQIRYDLARAGAVRIRVHNTLGQQVYEIAHTLQAPGSYQLNWNGKDQQGKQLPSGIYFLQFKSDDYSRMIKLMLLQ